MKKNFLFSLISILNLAIILNSCATPLPVADGIHEISVTDYQSLAEAKTQKKEVYSGLYNQLSLSLTRLDSEMTQAQLSHSARLMQWTEAQYRDEKSKTLGRLAQNTEYFISLYTPEKKHNDLSSSKSIWKIFLDIDGKRYTGTATKIKTQLSEIQALYPDHNRWSNAYILSFPVSTATTDGKPGIVTLTGTVTSTQVEL